MTDWDAINQRKNKEILANMAINAVVANKDTDLLASDTEYGIEARKSFKVKVKAIYALFAEVHNEITENP